MRVVIGEKKGKRKVGRALFGSQCSDGRKSIGRELKLFYSPRATSRCQKQKEVGFSPTLVPLNLRPANGRVVQPNHGTEFSDVGIVFRDNF